MNRVILSLGSNIEPEKNIELAVGLLYKMTNVYSISGVWETEAIGSNGPNFLNLAVCLKTKMSQQEIKEKLIKIIEKKLFRQRTDDKNAPRTIDLDIVVFNSKIVEPDLWTEPYLALPLAELLPDLRNQVSNQKLKEIAIKLNAISYNIQRPDLNKLIINK